MIDYAAELNEAQLKAAQFVDGPALVIAGAGSGKTRVLTYRVAHLVESGIPPESILLLTFTRRASQEMMRRAASILDGRCNRVAGGTFHSFANMILRRNAKKIGFSPNFTILDRDDSESAVNMVRSALGLDEKYERFPKKRALMDVISKSVNTGKSIKELLAHDYPHFAHFHEEVEAVGADYTAFKRAKNMMDYDDLLVHLKDLLMDDESVRKSTSNRYRYVMVDEYQDTNKLQGYIAALLASEHENILVVGDDAQSIYSFRGANFRNIMDFPNIFPSAETITLEQNYRSIQPILNLTNRIIANAREKFSKELYTDKEGDHKPEFVQPRDERAQAEFVCDTVLELREQDVPLSDIAVLFRNSFHSNELEVELTNRNIPYVKYGGLKFLEAAHVKDVMCFLKTVFNKDDEIAWRRVLLLLEGIGEKTASRIIGRILADPEGFPALTHDDFLKRKYSRSLAGLKSLYAGIKPKTGVTDMINAFLPYYKPLMQNKYDDHVSRYDDLSSLEAVASNFKSLESFLTQLTLEPPEKSIVDQSDSDDERLVLSTIHSAKGLEWHTVFMLSLLDGYLPDKRSLSSDEEIEEERRLFYVAATRAKENLYLVKPNTVRGGYGFYGDQSFNALLGPSRFLLEIRDFDDLVQERTWVEHDLDDDFDDDPMYYDEFADPARRRSDAYRRSRRNYESDY